MKAPLDIKAPLTPPGKQSLPLALLDIKRAVRQIFINLSHLRKPLRSKRFSP